MNTFNWWWTNLRNTSLQYSLNFLDIAFSFVRREEPCSACENLNIFKNLWTVLNGLLSVWNSLAITGISINCKKKQWLSIYVAHSVWWKSACYIAVCLAITFTTPTLPLRWYTYSSQGCDWCVNKRVTHFFQGSNLFSFLPLLLVLDTSDGNENVIYLPVWSVSALLCFFCQSKASHALLLTIHPLWTRFFGWPSITSLAALHNTPNHIEVLYIGYFILIKTSRNIMHIPMTMHNRYSKHREHG